MLCAALKCDKIHEGIKRLRKYGHKCGNESSVQANESASELNKCVNEHVGESNA